MKSLVMPSKLWFLLLITFFLNNSIAGQSDTVLLKAYGGELFEEAAQIIEYSAGGYAMVGTTGSNQTGNSDVFVARFDQDLNCVWSNNFGGSNVEWGLSIVNDASGNLLVCGYTLSFGAGGYDMWVIKVNSDGQLVWQMTYGGPDWDFAKQIIAHPSGGFLICGSTYSGGNGGQDGTLLHINDEGVLLSQHYFGGAGDDGINDLLALDGGYVACGYETIDNTVNSRVWRFDANDQLVWDRADFLNQNTPRKALALASDGNQLCIVGSVTYTDSYGSFEQVLQLDNSSMIEMIEVQDYDFSHLDCAFADGQIYLAGLRAIWGVELARIVRKQSDFVYTGAFEYSGPYRSRFHSVILTSEGMVFSGSYQPTSSQNWQVFMLKYTSQNLAGVAGTPQFLPCFSIGVEEEESQLGFDLVGQLINPMGQVVVENFDWNQAAQNQQVSPGIYYLRGNTTGSVRRLWIGN
jgi:hypothetical protein